MRGLLVAAVVMVATGAQAQDEAPSASQRPLDDEWIVSTWHPSSTHEGHAAGGLQAASSRVPSAGTFGDPLREALLFPGVTALASGVPLPVVRGFQPATTHLFVDGLRLPWAFHLQVGPSVVPPELIDSLVLHPGVSPARYGRHLGGTFELRLDTSPSPPSERVEGPVRMENVLTLDLLNAGVITRYMPSARTHVALSVRAGYSALIGSAVASASRSDGSSVAAGMYDYLARVDHQIATGTSVRLLAIGAAEGGGVRGRPDGDTYGARMFFHRGDLRLSSSQGQHAFELAATAGLDRAGLEAGGGGVLAGDFREAVLGLRGSSRLALADQVWLELGADVERRDAVAYQTAQFQVGGDDGLSVVRQPLGTAVVAGAYAQLAVQNLAGWELEAAARLDTWGVDGGRRRWVADPRVTVQRMFHPFLAHFSGGFVHQPATSLITLPTLDVVRMRLPIQEAVKLEAGAVGAFNPWTNHPGIDVGVTAFAHPYQRLLELSPLDADFQAQVTRGPDDLDPVLAQRLRPGVGYGVELSVRRAAFVESRHWHKRITAELAYTFQQSWREDTFQRRDATGAATGDTVTAWVSSPLEVMHAGNVVVRYSDPRGWKAGVTLVARSGLPEAGGVASYTQREGSRADGTPRWVPVDPDQVGRMPWYWRLDARVSKEWNFRAWSLEAYLDVLNVAFNQETLRYTYSEFAATQDDREAGNIELRRATLKLPVLLPMIGVTARL